MQRPAPPLPSNPLPISVLTGFLGSGKTALLSRVLSSPGLADTAVIVNEFGAVGLDHLLLEAADQEIVTLPNGCVCCVVRQDLADTLYRLLRRRASGELPPFQRLALETSGLAEPSPILYTLSADAFLEQALQVHAVVATIDAVAGAATLDRFPEATAQAACADRLVLTKTDLVTPPPALHQRLAALNPAASIGDVATVVPAAMLFGGVPAMSVRPRFLATAVHAHGIRAVVLVLRRPMSRLEFAMSLGGLAREHGEDLLRVKGIVAFADRDAGPAAIHAVQHTLYPPRWFDDWPDADRRSRLVFIVRDIATEILLDQFAVGDPMLAETAEMTTGGR
jgi:G3E family GTPase